MDRNDVRHALVGALEHIQQSGSYPIPELTGSIRPLEDLEGFDSHMGVTATGNLSAALRIPIAAGKNLFRMEGGTRKLTVDEVIDILVGLVAAHTAAPSSASAEASVASLASVTP